MPRELWYLILSFLSIKDLIKVGRVNKWLYRTIKTMTLDILVLVSINATQQVRLTPSFPLLIQVRPFIRLFPSQREKMWMHIDLKAFSLDECSRIARRGWPFAKVQVKRFLKNCEYYPKDVCFQEISILAPRVDELYHIKGLERVELLDFMEMGSRIDLRPLRSCKALKSISFQGERQIRQERNGIFMGSDFRDLPSTLSTLYFYGSWLDKWVLEPMILVSIISRLENLTFLMIDLDFTILGGDVILDLFSNLPKLKTFGRLGRVDKGFWRLCPKAIGSRLESLSVGMPKNPYITPMNRQGVNSSFLDSLGMGVLWFAPSIKYLEVWMGYEADQFRLINALSRIKEGPSWDLDGNIKLKQLREINVFEMCDVNALDDRAWKRLAGIPLSSQIKISIGSQDTFLEGTIKTF